MNIEKYKELFISENLMGPSGMQMLKELLDLCPLKLCEESVVLDLGCGKGLTSYIIECETDAKVYATDLWIKESDNQERFAHWGKADKLIAVNADANDLHFENNFFDAIFSMDSYHYFAGKPLFFIEKMLPILKPGGIMLIAIPGIKEEFADDSENLIRKWQGDDAHMFKSATWWKEIIGEHEDILSVDTWEMNCFESAWNDWFQTHHFFALNDYRYYKSIIRPYTNFIGIMIKKREL